jgi:leucine dehydrogenase
MKSMLTFSPNDLVNQMIDQNIKTGYVIQMNGEVYVSHPFFNELKEFIVHSPDNYAHEGIFWEADKATKSLFVAAVHRSNRGAGQGGTRLLQYPTIESIFTDAIRLAKGMTDKNACAGLWWGGGKGVIHPLQHPRTLQGEDRVNVFANYGRFVASLNGIYVCAEDMNTNPEDMRVIHANNRFCTCVPEEIGGSANPSTFTAYGVFKGILAAVHHLEGKNDQRDTNLKGRHVLVQGAGNVGWVVMEQVVEAGGRVTVFDISEVTKAKIRELYTEEQVCIEEDLNTFYALEADVFAPCAIGAILNDETIPILEVKIIAGAANNQLKNPVRHAEMLHQRNILYAPDFIINRMGIVNCANEQYGYLEETILEKVDEVYDFTLEMMKQSAEQNTSPQFIATEMADQLSKINHPIWQHRGAKLLKQYLTANPPA